MVPNDPSPDARPTPLAGTPIPSLPPAPSMNPLVTPEESVILSTLREVRTELRQTREEIRLRIFNVEEDNDATKRTLRRLQSRVEDLETLVKKLEAELREVQRNREQDKTALDQTVEAMKRHSETTTKATNDAVESMTKATNEAIGELNAATSRFELGQQNLERENGQQNVELKTVKTEQARAAKMTAAICDELGIPVPDLEPEPDASGAPAPDKTAIEKVGTPAPTPMKQTLATAAGARKVALTGLLVGVIQFAIEIVKWLNHQ